MQNKFLLTAVALLLSITSVFALPTISSEVDQSFDENQNISQARDITITDDGTTPTITAAHDIRIRIPSDFPIIWDIRVGYITVSGSAYDTDKFSSASLEVTYDAKAKTVTIPVAKDFSAGESVKISGLVF
ncbi:MAG: hypothetical protein WC304_04830, partial [Candidatus Gracilibacteria bacterium]